MQVAILIKRKDSGDVMKDRISESVPVTKKMQTMWSKIVDSLISFQPHLNMLNHWT
jgi:hypothetical protein